MAAPEAVPESSTGLNQQRFAPIHAEAGLGQAAPLAARHRQHHRQPGRQHRRQQRMALAHGAPEAAAD